MHRRHIDDAAPVFGLHAGQGQARCVKHAGQIDGDDGVPAFHRKVFNAADMLDAGVVDQNINAAKAAVDVIEHGRNVGRAAHVGTVVAGAAAEGADFGHCRIDIAEAV